MNPGRNKLPLLKAKQVVVNRPGLKIVRFCLLKGDRIPEHATKASVAVTVIRGKGIFTIGPVPHDMAPGVVLEMRPGVSHSIEATEDVEFVVVHMDLKEQSEEIDCGAEKML